MVREVDLVSYLPPFLAGYKETCAVLAAEDPEFVLAWEAADRILKNEFIATADEYGISRFEKMLNIFPAKREALENRRARVQSRWFTRLPYTWRMLIQKMRVICGDSDFKVYVPKGAWYEIGVRVAIEPQTEPLLQEIEQMLKNYLPANLCYQVTGNIARIKQVEFFAGSTKSIYVKVKVEPEPAQFLLARSVVLKAGTGTVKHIRTVYLPERNEVNGL